jgi:hypothetical protein
MITESGNYNQAALIEHHDHYKYVLKDLTSAKVNILNHIKMVYTDHSVYEDAQESASKTVNHCLKNLTGDEHRAAYEVAEASYMSVQQLHRANVFNSIGLRDIEPFNTLSNSIINNKNIIDGKIFISTAKNVDACVDNMASIISDVLPVGSIADLTNLLTLAKTSELIVSMTTTQKVILLLGLKITLQEGLRPVYTLIVPGSFNNLISQVITNLYIKKGLYKIKSIVYTPQFFTVTVIGSVIFGQQIINNTSHTFVSFIKNMATKDNFDAAKNVLDKVIDKTDVFKPTNDVAKTAVQYVGSFSYFCGQIYRAIGIGLFGGATEGLRDVIKDAKPK